MAVSDHKSIGIRSKKPFTPLLEQLTVEKHKVGVIKEVSYSTQVFTVQCSCKQVTKKYSKIVSMCFFGLIVRDYYTIDFTSVPWERVNYNSIHCGFRAEVVVFPAFYQPLTSGP